MEADQTMHLQEENKLVSRGQREAAALMGEKSCPRPSLVFSAENG